MLGAHVEGPFINPDKKGAHNPKFIKTTIGQSSIAEVYGSLENVAMVTIAPENKGALDTIPFFVKNNVTVSIGRY